MEKFKNNKKQIATYRGDYPKDYVRGVFLNYINDSCFYFLLSIFLLFCQ